MNNKDTINQKRRDILKTFAASGISKSIISASPFVTGMLMARHADAANGKIKRAVSIYIPGGGIQKYWAPTGSGASMQMGKMSKGYESAKTDCNFLTGMTHPNGGHGVQPLVLSGGWGQESFDVTMGRELGQGMPFKYLNLGVHSNGHGVITKDGNTNVPFQDNPFTAFKLMFGSGNADPGKAEFPFAKILDVHADAAKAIKNKLGNYEVHRMDEHLDAIADTRKRLEATAGGSGGGSASCGSAPDGAQFALTHETFSQQAKLQADIIAAALKCNFTASCSLGLGNHQCEFRIPELNFTGQYHQSIHGGSNGKSGYPYYTEMRSHLGSLVAYLINNLKSSGILDDTIIVEATDMGHADQHSNSDVPMMMAGGSNAIRTGVVTRGNGYSQHDMLHTAAKAAGVTLPYGKVIPGVIKS